MPLEQRTDDSAGRAACAEYQDVFALDLDTQVEFKVAQQANAIGIVADHFAVFEGHGINGAGSRGALTHPIDEFRHRRFMRHGDIQTLAGGGAECRYRSGKSIASHFDCGVVQMLPGLGGEQAVARLNRCDHQK